MNRYLVLMVDGSLLNVKAEGFTVTCTGDLLFGDLSRISKPLCFPDSAIVSGAWKSVVKQESIDTEA